MLEQAFLRFNVKGSGINWRFCHCSFFSSFLLFKLFFCFTLYSISLTIMSTYENNNNPAVTSSQTFSHGYGPNAGPSYKPPEQPGHYSQNYAGYAHRGINDYKVHSNAANMSVRRGSAEPEGESAAYDNQADNDDSHSLPDRQTVVTAPPHRIKSRYNDRGIKEYFYKRPDPTYEDIYGVAQPPQLDVSTQNKAVKRKLESEVHDICHSTSHANIYKKINVLILFLLVENQSTHCVSSHWASYLWREKVPG